MVKMRPKNGQDETQDGQDEDQDGQDEAQDGQDEVHWKKPKKYTRQRVSMHAWRPFQDKPIETTTGSAALYWISLISFCECSESL